MKVSKSIFIVGLICFLLSFLGITSCHLAPKNKMSVSTNQTLSQKIVTAKLASWAEKNNVWVDSLLKDRETIFNENEFMTPNKLLPELFYPEKEKLELDYQIPDSLSNRVSYIKPNLDIENGTETVLYFSPLILTKEKNVYAMQVYICNTIFTEDTMPKNAYRFASRHFDLYKFNSGRIQFLKTISSDEDLFSLPFLKHPQKK